MKLNIGKPDKPAPQLNIWVDAVLGTDCVTVMARHSDDDAGQALAIIDTGDDPKIIIKALHKEELCAVMKCPVGSSPVVTGDYSERDRAVEALGQIIGDEKPRAIAHLMQALASGRMSLDQLRVLRESAPRFVNILAIGLDTNTGDLMHMAADGRLTTLKIAEAMA